MNKDQYVLGPGVSKSSNNNLTEDNAFTPGAGAGHPNGEPESVHKAKTHKTKKESTSRNPHDFKPSESGPKRGEQVTSAAADEGELTNDYRQQNQIGRDIQPIDPEFHVYRPINWVAIKTHPDMAAADVIRLSGGKIGQQQAWQLIQDVIKSKGGKSCDLNLSPSTYYNDLESISPYEPNTLVALSLATGKSSYASTPNTPLKDLAPYQTNLSDYMKNRQYKYECRLFNFYADNNKYFSAQFTLTGRIGMEYGKRIVWFDERRRYAWEGYLTGVSHDFRYDANGTGWTTTITVERMLPFTFDEARELLTEQNTGMLWRRDMDSYRTVSGGEQDVTSEPIKGNFNKRFNMMWGHAEPFVGGFFGEQTLASMISQANSREQAYMTKFTGGGSSSGGSSSNSGSSADGTGSVKEDDGQVHCWHWSDCPSDVKTYAHDPASAGLKYGSSSGWSNEGDQCTNFTNSYVHAIYHTSKGSVMGNGKDMANSWHSAFGSSSKLTSTPKTGAIAGSTNSIETNMPQYGHTWVVQHVLKNGDCIVAEEDWPNQPEGSGYDVHNSCTYDIAIKPKKALTSTQYCIPDKSPDWG